MSADAGLHPITLGGGDTQDLVFLPAIRVLTANVIVQDYLEDVTSAERILLVSGAATLDAADTTITSPAGAGQSNERLMLIAGGAEAAFTVGRHYQIEGTRGRETFHLEHTEAGQLLASQPLRGDYSSTSDVQGIEFRRAFPLSTLTDVVREQIYEDDRPLTATWTYTLDEKATRADMRVVIQGRTPFAEVLGTVAQSMRITWPGLLRALREDGNALRDIIKRAADRIEFRVRMLGRSPDDEILGQIGHELVEAQAVELLALDGKYPPGYTDHSEWLREARAHFAYTWKSYASSKPHDVTDIFRDVDGDEADGVQTIRDRAKAWRP